MVFPANRLGHTLNFVDVVTLNVPATGIKIRNGNRPFLIYEQSNFKFMHSVAVREPQLAHGAGFQRFAHLLARVFHQGVKEYTRSLRDELAAR